VGTGTSVSISGLSLSGAQAGDYSVIQPSTTANITKAGLTVSGITANNKPYDGTTTATLNTSGATLVGVFSGDTVTLDSSGYTATFAQSSRGTGIAVNVSGLSLSGAQAGDYTLTQPSGLTANITYGLTVSGITANNKPYDSTTAATLNTSSATLVGVNPGDTVTLVTSGDTATFATKDVGTGISVNVSGLSLSGAQAVFYTLIQPSGLTANITQFGLTVSITANNKVYDDTTAATLNTSSATLVGVFSGDTVTLNTSAATATFATKDVGTGIAVNVSGLSLSGAQAGDYTLTQPSGLTANITKRDLVSTFRNGTWFLDQAPNAGYSAATTRQFNFGMTGDIPVSGDWDGEGLQDVGVFRPSTGQWFLDAGNKNDTNNPVAGISFGTTGDVPIVGHWLGGSIDYIGVWRPSTGTFFLSLTNTSFDGIIPSDSNHLTFQWGTAGDTPVVGDWNGSGISQVGVFRPSDPGFGGAGGWYLDQGNVAFPANKMPVIPAFTFGGNSDIPVVGHWLGGNDLAGVFRPGSGTFFLSKTNTSFDGNLPSDSNHLTFQWGGAGDTPVVGDWTGNGISDVGVFRPSDPAFGGQAGWYLDAGNVAWNSAPPTIAPFQFGDSHDRPASGAWQLAGLPQLLDGTPGDGAASLSADQLQMAATEALGNWQAAGLSASQLALLQGAQFDVTSLPSGWLGESLGNVVLIDATADGHGWSVGGPVAGQVDLLTVVEHEMGHLLGLSDVTAGSANLMSETLAPGMRRAVDGNVSFADPTGGTPSVVTLPSVSLAALSSADTQATGRGADTPNINWSSLDRYFAASPQVDDAVPDAMVDGRVATSTWRDNAETGQIQEERDDFFAAIA
jgi:hypothetical protein